MAVLRCHLDRSTVATHRVPQAFGAVYLGQSFAALVSAANAGEGALAAVGLRVELAAERGRGALLYDSSGQPLARLGAGQCHAFSIKHDIRDLVGGWGSDGWVDGWAAWVVAGSRAGPPTG